MIESETYDTMWLKMWRKDKCTGPENSGDDPEKLFRLICFRFDISQNVMFTASGNKRKSFLKGEGSSEIWFVRNVIDIFKMMCVVLISSLCVRN